MDGLIDHSFPTINSSSFTGRSPVLFSAEILRGPSSMNTGSDYFAEVAMTLGQAEIAAVHQRILPVRFFKSGIVRSATMLD